MLLVKKYIYIFFLHFVLCLNRILRFFGAGTTFYLFYTALDSIQLQKYDPSLKQKNPKFFLFILNEHTSKLLVPHSYTTLNF